MTVTPTGAEIGVGWLSKYMGYFPLPHFYTIRLPVVAPMLTT